MRTLISDNFGKLEFRSIRYVETKWFRFIYGDRKVLKLWNRREFIIRGVL